MPTQSPGKPAVVTGIKTAPNKTLPTKRGFHGILGKPPQPEKPAFPGVASKSPLAPKSPVTVKKAPDKVTYTVPAGTPSFCIFQWKDSRYVLRTCTNNGKELFSQPDSLEGILKLLLNKATYFAKLAKRTMSSYKPVPYYNPQDETDLATLNNLATAAGEPLPTVK